jgi:nicotinamidase-related amidase
MWATRDISGFEGRAIASATPYPWPYHGCFDPSEAALVACLDPSWRRGDDHSDEADGRMTLLAHALQRVGGLVVAVTSVPARPAVRSHWRDQPRPNDVAVAFAPDVRVEASGVDAFFGSALEDTLRSQRRHDLILCGWGLEGPVHSTMRTANDRGYECVLVPDACTSLERSLIANASLMVEFSGGIFGAVSTTDDVVELLGPFDPTHSN